MVHDVAMKHAIASLLASLLFLSTVIAAVAQTGIPITLQSGHSVVLAVPGVNRVAVGDGRIAGVVPIGDSQILINGKTPGRTSVFIFSGGHRTAYEVTVTEQTLDEIGAMVRSAINVPTVNVVSFNHALVVRGSVDTNDQLAKINDIIARFSKIEEPSKYTIVNAVTVARPLGDIQNSIDRIAGTNNVRLDADQKGNVVVSGTVRDRTQAEAILSRARGLAGPYLATDGKVIDRLETMTTSQVQVKVQVLEIDETGLKQLGLRLQAGTPDPNHPGFLLQGPPFFPLTENCAACNDGKALTAGAFFRTVRLMPSIDLLITNGNAKILSEPNLLTMPGKEATFLVGGEIPIPFSTGLGQVSVVFKEFGVKLKMTPTLLGNGGVDTIIAPEVSSLDFQDGVNIGGFTIPALKTSRLATEVVTQSGESIVMGGLLQHIETRDIQKIPLLGDLPILGQLFRSTRYQTSHSDVVFIMTPEIVTK